MTAKFEWALNLTYDPTAFPSPFTLSLLNNYFTTSTFLKLFPSSPPDGDTASYLTG